MNNSAQQRIVHATGMVWYREEDYPAILSIMSDAHLLPRTWLQWKDKAEQGEKKQRRLGHTVFRVILIPDEFTAFCRRDGLNLDAKARTLYAADGARQRAGGLN